MNDSALQNRNFREILKHFDEGAYRPQPPNSSREEEESNGIYSTSTRKTQ
jgi:hypothetical protein